MKIMKGRAVALTMAMALLTVAFAGLFLVEGAENPTPPLSVAVTADPIYVGDEVTFNLTGWMNEWDYAEFTVTIMMDDGAAEAMTYNMDDDTFDYMWTAVAGDHVWSIDVTNTTDSMAWNANDTIHVYEYPAFIGAGTDMAMEEDMAYMVNLSAEFSGEGLTFAEDVMVHENLTVAIDDYMMTITPAAEWDGTEMVKVVATDMNMMMVNNTFTFVVAAVDDAPMLYGIDFMGETIMAEEMNVTTEYDENMTAINWTMVMAIQLDIDEDAMEINFTVNATDVDTEMLTFDFEEGDYYTLTVPNASMPCHFNFTGDMDMFGLWEANLTVSDGTTDVMEMVWFNVMPVNDAPMGEFVNTIPEDMTFAIETGVDLSVEVSVEDVDDMNLTVIWKIDGVTAQESNMTLFKYNWTMAGTYNVTVYTNDGVNDDVMIGYYLAVVTEPAPTWTAADVETNYTEGSGDVAVADADGIIDWTYSNLRTAADWDGLDITAIATALSGDNLVVTVSFAATPMEGYIGVDSMVVYYELYFVKSGFTEAAFSESAPNMGFTPADEDVYSFGFYAYVDEDYAVTSGNDMVYTIPLSEIDAAGVTPGDFNIFFTAYLRESKLDGLTLKVKAGYDSAGLAAATHVTPVTSDDDDDDDDDEDDFPWVIVIIIVVVLLIVIILVVVFMMKGKKGEEEEMEAPPMEEPVGEEMPLEGGEMPVEGEMPPPMEGVEEPPMEGAEAPMPEEPVPAPEEPVPAPEEPVVPAPEEPVPAPEEPVPAPEEPVPPMPEQPAPPVPPAPEPPMPPQ